MKQCCICSEIMNPVEKGNTFKLKRCPSCKRKFCNNCGAIECKECITKDSITPSYLATILTLALALIICSFSATADLNSNLAHVWSFEEEGGLIIDQITANGTKNGTVTAATYNATGKNNNALLYSGSNAYVRFNNDQFMNGLNELTICTWFNSTSTSGTEAIWSFEHTGAPVSLVRQAAGGQLTYRLVVGGTEESLTGSAAPTNNQFHLVCNEYNGTHVYGWLDGDMDGAPQPASGTVNHGTDYPFQTGAQENALLDFYGVIDELYIWERGLTETEKDDLYAAGVGSFYPFAAPAQQSVNASVNAFDVNVSDFSLSSSSFVTVHVELFNSSATDDYTIYTAMNVQKTTGGGSNDVYGRILIDGSVVNSQLLRSVSTVGDQGSTGFPHIVTRVGTGQHNITMQMRRTGTGTVEVDDIDMMVLQGTSNAGKNIIMQQENISTLFTASDFSPIHNFTFTKLQSSDLFMCGVFTANGTSSEMAYNYQNTDTGRNSSFAFRDVGSAASFGFGFIDNVSSFVNNYSLQALSTGSVELNGTIAILDLLDSNNNTIPHNYSGNKTSTYTQNYTLNAGQHRLTSILHTPTNGTAFTAHAFVTGHSTSGANTPTFTLESLGCSTKKERRFTGTSDGAVFMYLYCPATVGTQIRIDLNATIGAGETFVVADEGLSLIELTTIDSGELKFIEFNITAPANDTHFGSSQGSQWQVNITGSSSSNATCNLTLNGILNQSVDDIDLGLGYTYNVSIGASQTGIQYNTSVICVNADSNTLSHDVSVWVDNVLPVISVFNPTEGQNFVGGNIQVNSQCTDQELFRFNVTGYNNTNGIVFSNESTNIVGAAAVFNQLFTTADFGTGNNRIEATCADSHTANILQFLDDPAISTGTYYFSDTDVGTLSIQVRTVGAGALSYSKRNDRYSFDYDVSTPTDELEYTIRADKIELVAKDMYSSHLVINDMFWWDGEVNGVTVLSESVVIDPDGKEAEITLYLDEAVEHIETESLGEVNIVTLIRNFSTFVTSTPNITLQEPVNQSFINTRLFTFRFNLSDVGNHQVNSTVQVRPVGGAFFTCGVTDTRTPSGVVLVNISSTNSCPFVQTNNYEWRVISTDGINTTTTPVYNFTYNFSNTFNYNVTLPASFGKSDLDLNTTAGVLLFILLLMTVIAGVVLAEYSRLPAMSVLAGLGIIMFSLMVGWKASMVIGVIGSGIGVVYIIWSVLR